MALLSNKPEPEALRRRLSRVPDIEVTADEELLAELLDAAVADIEDKGLVFDGRWAQGDERIYDGTGGNRLIMRTRPVTYVQFVKVSLPVLSLDRTYLANELKLYRDQGQVQVFTFKLAAEQASLHLDQQVYGNIFPPLPRSIEVQHTLGFPRYDEELDVTSLDGTTVVNGFTVLSGDQRWEKEKNWIKKLQQAAICDAAASYLAQVATQGVGLVQAVSFDGYSQSNNPQAYGATVQALVEARDRYLASRNRGYYTSTAGG